MLPIDPNINRICLYRGNTPSRATLYDPVRGQFILLQMRSGAVVPSYALEIALEALGVIDEMGHELKIIFETHHRLQLRRIEFNDAYGSLCIYVDLLYDKDSEPEIRKEEVESRLLSGCTWGYQYADVDVRLIPTDFMADDFAPIADKYYQDTSIKEQRELAFYNLLRLDAESDAQKRGYLLEKLMNCAFMGWGIQTIGSFRRNDGAEQIDGAFSLDGWHYLLECRWRKKPADTRDIDGLYGQVQRSGKQTMGLFLSISGWSENVPNLLKQNASKEIILMDGKDLRGAIINGALIDLREFLRAKAFILSTRAEPHYGIDDYAGDLQRLFHSF